MSRVEGKMSRVEGKMSSVEGSLKCRGFIKNNNLLRVNN